MPRTTSGCSPQDLFLGGLQPPRVLASGQDQVRRGRTQPAGGVEPSLLMWL